MFSAAFFRGLGKSYESSPESSGNFFLGRRRSRRGGSRGYSYAITVYSVIVFYFFTLYFVTLFPSELVIDVIIYQYPPFLPHWYTFFVRIAFSTALRLVANARDEDAPCQWLDIYIYAIR